MTLFKRLCFTLKVGLERDMNAEDQRIAVEFPGSSEERALLDRLAR